jgi:hypothetical protein
MRRIKLIPILNGLIWEQSQELSISVRNLVILEIRGISRVHLALDALLPMEHVISGIIKPRL